MDDNPFDNIESAYRYVSLLGDAVIDAQSHIHEDIGLLGGGESRRVEALKLVAYKLSRLRRHMETSVCILNDLRALRRLLLSERDDAVDSSAGTRMLDRSSIDADAASHRA